MKKFARLLTTTPAPLAVALSSPALATTHLLVSTYEAPLGIYDVNNGSGTVRPSVALPELITEMECNTSPLKHSSG